MVNKLTDLVLHLRIKKRIKKRIYFSDTYKLHEITMLMIILIIWCRFSAIIWTFFG